MAAKMAAGWGSRSSDWSISRRDVTAAAERAEEERLVRTKAQRRRQKKGGKKDGQQTSQSRTVSMPLPC
jgi:hypothetical protein